ncbi:MAG: hypothetical protein ACLVB5_03995 [Christensenellales bacterium]
MLTQGDKVAFVGDGRAWQRTTLFQILMGEMEPDEGSYQVGRDDQPEPISPRTTATYFDGVRP